MVFGVTIGEAAGDGLDIAKALLFNLLPDGAGVAEVDADADADGAGAGAAGASTALPTASTCRNRSSAV